MTLLGLILFFIVVGFLLWLVNTYIPMAPQVKTLLNVAVVIILVIWLIQSLGIVGPLNMPIRTLR